MQTVIAQYFKKMKDFDLKKYLAEGKLNEEIKNLKGNQYALVKKDGNKLSILGVGTKDQVENLKTDLESKNKNRSYSVKYTLHVHRAPKI